MLSENLTELADQAEKLADITNHETREAEAHAREVEFSISYNAFLDYIELLCRADQMVGINIQKEDYNEVLEIIKQAKKVLKTQTISNRNNINQQLANRNIKFKQMKNKWLNAYKNLSSIKEVMNMLDLLKNVYSGTPSAQVLLNDVKKLILPGYDFNFADLNKAFDSIEKSKAIIQNMEIDQEIKSFLKKVSDNTAKLSDLSDKTFKWLKDNNLLSSMKIINSN